MVQMLTDMNPRQTVVSVDGIGAFDLVSSEERHVAVGQHARWCASSPIRPTVLFHTFTSTHVWEVEMGDPQMIPQGEGGEQGDPLMPLLFSLDQHSVLDAVISRLQEGESVCSHFQIIYLHVLCDPGRVAKANSILEEELWRHARIQIHQGKTKRLGRPRSRRTHDGPQRNRVERRVIPTTKQSFEDWDALSDTLISSRILSKSSDRHDVLLRRIAMVEDLQSAWLLLIHCAVARANFFLRSVNLGQFSTFISHHDDQIWACLCTLLGIDLASVTHSSRIGATLPLRLGGLGLSSAVRLRHAAHWASWVDCIRMVHLRHPIVARTIIEAVEANDRGQAAQGVVSSSNSLRTAGFVIPSWDELIGDRPGHGSVDEEDPSQPRFGRQKDAAAVVHKVFLEEEVRPLLDEPEEALLRSHGGPLASVLFTSPRFGRPLSRLNLFVYSFSAAFALALPISARWSRCGRPLDCRGHHRSACSRAGILGRRPSPDQRHGATSTLASLTSWMAGDWKSSLTDSFHGEAPN